MSDIWLLLWAQLKSHINGLLYGAPLSRLKNIGALLARAGSFVVIYVALRYVMFPLFEWQMGPGSSDKIFLLMIHSLGAILLLGAIKYAYQVFFLSEDLEWLLASPVPTSRIFIAKFIENWLYNGQFVFAFGWPIVLAYGTYVQAPAIYYPIGIIGTALLAIYTGAIGVLVCLPLMRYIGANRMRELLLTVSLGLSIGLYVLFRQLGMASTGMVKVYTPVWLPTSHLGILLRSLAIEYGRGILVPALAFMIPAIVLAWLSHFLSKRIYIHGLQRKGEQDDKVRTSGGEGLLYRMSTIIPADIRAVALKDALETIRSPRQWFYLVFASVILFFQVFGQEFGDTPEAGYLFFLIFLVTIFSQELTILGISRESNVFPLVAASGIRSWRLFLSKWLIAYIPSVVFGVTATLVIGIFKHEPPGMIVSYAVIVFLATISMISYSVMIGCLAPNFKSFKTRQRISPWVLILNMVFMMVLLIIVMIPMALISYLRMDPVPLWFKLAYLVFLVGIGIGTFALSFTVGSARLRQLLRDVPDTTQ